MEFLNYKNLSYILMEPKNFDESKKYPAILFLHGAGSRGSDLNIIKSNPFCVKMSEKENFPFLTFCPQCNADTWFSIFEQIIDFAYYISMHKNVDSSHFYVMGASMGGYATWQLAMSAPKLFAAIVPICGGGMYWNAARLKNIPVWAFHGEKDNVVLCDESRKMVDSVNKNGGNALLTTYPDVYHNSWDNVYDSNEVFDWLLKQKKNSEPNKNQSGFVGSRQFG